MAEQREHLYEKILQRAIDKVCVQKRPLASLSDIELYVLPASVLLALPPNDVASVWCNLPEHIKSHPDLNDHRPCFKHVHLNSLLGGEALIARRTCSTCKLYDLYHKV